MKVSLSDILPQAAQSHYAIAGFNVFSIEWAQAVIRAAEYRKQAVIIMTNRSMIEHLPPQYCGPIFSDMAKKSTVPVCVHLDHCTDYTIIESAIKHGFSSVMYDGSHYSLAENIANTNTVRKLAQQYGISIEGEVGTVRYTDMPETNTQYTSPEEAEKFACETKVDALAISVGSIHRMTTQSATIQYERIHAIEKLVSTPLVIHGTSGITRDDLKKIKRHRIAKCNIGTILRQAFSDSLRNTLEKNKEIFDIFEITKSSYKSIECVAGNMLELLEEEKI